jgi:phenylalanyl-tRNA synthetase beta chain
MKLFYSWLCDYLSLEVSSERMSEILTSVGLEVEHMEKKEAVKGNLDGIVIGKVLKLEMLKVLE